MIQTGPEFVIEEVESIDADAQALLMPSLASESSTYIAGKDLPLEETIANMSGILANLGMKIEIASWRNIVPNVWSLHIRDAQSPMCFTNGKGSTKESALASALGEFIERLNCNFFYNDQFWGEDLANAEFVHYPDEKWFKPGPNGELPEGILDEYCLEIYNPDDELLGTHLYDTNSGNTARGICSLPFVRQSDGETVYFPSNLIENLYLSNGMSAGNTLAEAQVQCLSEIFERAVKREILEGEIALPDVPEDVLAKYPGIAAGIKGLEEQGFPVLVKDASLGGQFPVMCVTLMNPRTGGVFASFGAHPSFEVALERSLTELLQGRSFEGLNDLPRPTFSSNAVTEPNNFVEHFIDSSGVVSWRFFSAKADFDFVEWDFSGQGENSNAEEAATLFGILEDMGKEVYVAVYDQLGATARRILAPGYSEVYPVEDLIWDNTNKALLFRADILNLHRLDDAGLAALLERLEDCEFIDDYTDIPTLIGIAFDESRSRDIVVHPLLTETLALVVSRSHPLARENALRLQALDAQPLILLSSEFATREQIDRYCRRHRLEPDVRMEANSIGAVLSVIRRTPLATLLPAAIAGQFDDVVAIELRPALLQRTACLLQRQGAWQSAAAREFITLARENAITIEQENRQSLA